MNFLLAPAIFVMNRMRFGAKFAFILIGFTSTTRHENFFADFVAAV